MSLLIFFVLLSLGVSFICSVLEAALLSLTPSYIAQQKPIHPKLYTALKVLKDQIDKPLAAILTLNTVAHTVGATGVGAQVTVLFGDAYLGIASAAMTMLILVFSEILPKTLGARYWMVLAPILPAILNGMIFLLRPFIWLSDQIMKLLGAPPHKHDLRQEIKALTILGRELNALDEDEQRVIANILDLQDVKVRDIMTPRVVCEYVAPDVKLEEFLARAKQSQFSRYPVLDENESPKGLIFKSDLLGFQQGQLVVDAMRPVKVVIDTMSVELLMTQFMQDHQHLGLVYDEYGSWLGLITLEDIIETIIGKPIMDETDDIPNMRRHAKRLWKKRLKDMEG